jgi:hypothetical protein
VICVFATNSVGAITFFTVFSIVVAPPKVTFSIVVAPPKVTFSIAVCFVYMSSPPKTALEVWNYC